MITGTLLVSPFYIVTGGGMSDAEKLLAEAEEVRDRLRDEKILHCDELRQFAYAVSHDLRDPLRMVKSYTQLLERRLEQHSDADRREFVRHIAGEFPGAGMGFAVRK